MKRRRKRRMTTEEFGRVGGYLLRIERSRRATSRPFTRGEVLSAWCVGVLIGMWLSGR